MEHRDQQSGWMGSLFSFPLVLPTLKENADLVKVTYFLLLPFWSSHPCSPPPPLQQPLPGPHSSSPSLRVSTHLIHFPLSSSIYALAPQVKGFQNKGQYPPNGDGMATGVVTVTHAIKDTCSVLPSLKVACSSPQLSQESNHHPVFKGWKGKLEDTDGSTRESWPHTNPGSLLAHIKQEHPQSASRVPLSQVTLGSEHTDELCRVQILSQ